MIDTVSTYNDSQPKLIGAYGPPEGREEGEWEESEDMIEN